MLPASYNDSFFNKLKYVSNYVPGKELERKRSSNLQTQKPCCLLAVYCFLREKGWKVQEDGMEKAGALALPFPLVEGT